MEEETDGKRGYCSVPCLHIVTHPPPSPFSHSHRASRGGVQRDVNGVGVEGVGRCYFLLFY